MDDLTSAGRGPDTQSRLPVREQLSADLRTYWPLWLIVGLAVFLRLYEIGHVPGMNGDEGWYGLQARLWLAGEAVTWRTPTGNVPGMLHLWSLILLHTVFPPSLLLLRVPVLISSLAAIALAYATGRRFFGPAAGLSAAVLMASLPISIAYARLGWDPGHSPLLILAASYAAFAGRKLLTALLFALAVTNHPSAAFAAPFLTLGFLGFDVGRRDWRHAIVNSAEQAGLLLLGILLGAVLSPAAGHYLSAARSLARLVDPSAWASFCLKFGRLLSGDTVYAYVVGQGLGPAQIWADAIVGVGLAGLVVAGLVVLRRRTDWATAGVLAGWLASLALLYLVAGSWVLNPKLERFAVPMVPLTALAIAALLNLTLARHRKLLQPLLAAIALPLLAGFWLHYVRPLRDGSAQPMQGFWTAGQDPGQLAYQRISADPAARGGGRIIAENWWLHMPVAYYAVGRPFSVTNAQNSDRNPATANELPTYWLTYEGSKFDRSLAGRSDVRRRWTIATGNSRNKIQIWWKPAGRPEP